ncbi:uncharacterized protein LOC110907229 [Helianthus annuus]|uniref:uncharacterized protein LOC110907229 n=1 Tax=Helianthus annuus TaxID=4232 RepID=UPI000B90111B|nr:uncharacterized protein LOC110907229 [Helianthus annuus]
MEPVYKAELYEPKLISMQFMTEKKIQVKATYRAEEDDKKVYVSDNVMEQLITKDLKDPNLDLELEQEFSDENAGVVTTHGFKCELCDVTCTSAENLSTHVKGKKHLRIVRAAEDMAKKDEGVEMEKEEAVEKTDGVIGEEENDDS